MRRQIGFRSLKMAEARRRCAKDRVKKSSRSVQERQDTIFDTPPTFKLDLGTVSWAILGPSFAHLRQSWAPRGYQEGPQRALRRPRSPKIDPRSAPSRAKPGQDRPRSAKIGPRSAELGPRRRRCPKMAAMFANASPFLNFLHRHIG